MWACKPWHVAGERAAGFDATIPVRSASRGAALHEGRGVPLSDVADDPDAPPARDRRHSSDHTTCATAVRPLPSSRRYCTRLPVSAAPKPASPRSRQPPYCCALPSISPDGPEVVEEFAVSGIPFGGADAENGPLLDVDNQRACYLNTCPEILNASNQVNIDVPSPGDPASSAPFLVHIAMSSLS